MNDDENTAGPQPWIDPALEARVVASVLGEASAFEMAELERLMDENPELAIFNRRIKAVHSLVDVAAHPDKSKRRLSAERRQKLLAAIGGKPPSAKHVAVLEAPRSSLLSPWLLVQVAVCLAVLFILSSISIPAVTGSLEKARAMSPNAAKQNSADAFKGESGGFVATSETPVPTAPSAQPSGIAFSGGVASPAVDNGSQVGYEKRKIDSAISEQLESALKSRTASSAASVSMPGIIPPVPSATRSEEAPSSEVDAKDGVLAAADESKAQQFSARGGKGAAAGGAALRSSSDKTVLSKRAISDRVDHIVPDSDGPSNKLDAIDSDSLSRMSKQPADAGADKKLAELNAATQPFSTFSLHVSDVSFQLAKDALARGGIPDPDRIRPEEFYNAFEYGDPLPAVGEEVSCRIEQCAHPFLQQRNLVRIAMKVAATGRNASQPLRLTVLLDTSGSMEREDRAASVRQALQTLATLLGPNDRITLIGFARTPRLLAEHVLGDQAGKLVEIAARTPSEGGTNLELALKLATEMAIKQRVHAAQNRIVLLTDGAANLGDADPGRLSKQIEKARQEGISFDACGVGADGLNDEILEALTRKGDGRYYFLNKPEDADAGFARQLAGAFRPAAENVKVQVRFNPERVSQYRLIGFEKHLLKKEDFHNDKVGAAELAADEAGVAVYQVEALPEGEGELGEVSVRFRDPSTGRMVERMWTMTYDAKAPSFNRASPSMQLAASAALVAEKLQGNQEIDLKSLAPAIGPLRSQYSNQPRVGDLIKMIERLRK